MFKTLIERDIGYGILDYNLIIECTEHKPIPAVVLYSAEDSSQRCNYAIKKFQQSCQFGKPHGGAVESVHCS